MHKNQQTLMTTRDFARTVLVTSLMALGLGAPAQALAQASGPLPGKGIKVLPLQSALAEETFQTLLVTRALKKLGYDVQPIKEVEYPMAHLAVANGDATFIANHWNPHHSEFYNAAGGDAKLSRQGVYSAGAAQGYMIDKKTADAHKITHISQLTDPKLAKLFDTNGDGKADLLGASAGWGGEAVINHHLDTFKLRGTVHYVQGNYPALIADTYTRFKQGQPVLFYAWTPYWLANVLRPGQDVVWLEIPFSAMPGVQAGMDTRQPNGKNYGWPINHQHIVANKDFAAKNPAAAKLFQVMSIPLADISSQNRLMQDGQNRQQDIERHTDAWIKAYQKTFDGWIQTSLQAAN